jgi:hypothetical protein
LSPARAKRGLERARTAIADASALMEAKQRCSALEQRCVELEGNLMAVTSQRNAMYADFVEKSHRMEALISQLIAERNTVASRLTRPPTVSTGTDAMLISHTRDAATTSDSVPMSVWFAAHVSLELFEPFCRMRCTDGSRSPPSASVACLSQGLWQWTEMPSGLVSRRDMLVHAHRHTQPLGANPSVSDALACFTGLCPAVLPVPTLASDWATLLQGGGVVIGASSTGSDVCVTLSAVLADQFVFCVLSQHVDDCSQDESYLRREWLSFPALAQRLHDRAMTVMLFEPPVCDHPTGTPSVAASSSVVSTSQRLGYEIRFRSRVSHGRGARGIRLRAGERPCTRGGFVFQTPANAWECAEVSWLPCAGDDAYEAVIPAWLHTTAAVAAEGFLVAYVPGAHSVQSVTESWVGDAGRRQQRPVDAQCQLDGVTVMLSSAGATPPCRGRSDASTQFSTSGVTDLQHVSDVRSRDAAVGDSDRARSSRLRDAVDSLRADLKGIEVNAICGHISWYGSLVDTLLESATEATALVQAHVVPVAVGKGVRWADDALSMATEYQARKIDWFTASTSTLLSTWSRATIATQRHAEGQLLWVAETIDVTSDHIERVALEWLAAERSRATAHSVGLPSVAWPVTENIAADAASPSEDFLAISCLRCLEWGNRRADMAVAHFADVASTVFGAAISSARRAAVAMDDCHRTIRDQREALTSKSTVFHVGVGTEANDTAAILARHAAMTALLDCVVDDANHTIPHLADRVDHLEHQTEMLSMMCSARTLELNSLQDAYCSQRRACEALEFKVSAADEACQVAVRRLAEATAKYEQLQHQVIEERNEAAHSKAAIAKEASQLAHECATLRQHLAQAAEQQRTASFDRDVLSLKVAALEQDLDASRQALKQLETAPRRGFPAGVRHEQQHGIVPLPAAAAATTVQSIAGPHAAAARHLGSPPGGGNSRQRLGPS